MLTALDGACEDHDVRRLSQLRVMTGWLAALALPVLGCHSSGGSAGTRGTGTGGAAGIPGSGGTAGRARLKKNRGGADATGGTNRGPRGLKWRQRETAPPAPKAAPEVRPEAPTPTLRRPSSATTSRGRCRAGPGGNWTQIEQPGAVAVDGGQYHSGTRAVKFTPRRQWRKTAYIRLGCRPPDFSRRRQHVLRSDDVPPGGGAH